MANQHTYRDLIFTNHAYGRLKQRSLSQHGVWETVHQPHQKIKKGKNTKYIRTIKGRKYQVVAKQLPRENKYLVISLWIRGETDKLPLAWRLIRFPFVVVWKLLVWLWNLLWK